MFQKLFSLHKNPQLIPGHRRRAVGYLTVQVKRKGTTNWEYLCKDKHNIGTNAGDDLLHAQMYTNNSAGTQGCNYIGVTSNATAPADTDTTLTGEIASGGLARAIAPTRTHSAGTNTTVLEITFTSSATHTNVQKTALFNASSSGTMAHENTFTATTLASGDELKVTWTITSTF